MPSSTHNQDFTVTVNALTMSCRTLYVGNLPDNITEREVENLFGEYGRIVDIDLKALPRYCFVMFEDACDAQDAVRCRDGYNFDGNRLRVELARAGHGQLSSTDLRVEIARGREVFRRSQYRVVVTGLPPSASWQDLKEHMQRAGDVWYSQVFRDSSGTTGIADYTNYDDMKYATRYLDHSEFKNAFSHGAFIRVCEYKCVQKRSISHSPSCAYSRSRSRSRTRIRSRNPNCSKSRNNSLRRGSPSRSMDKIGSPRNGSKSVRRSRSRSRSPSYSRSLAVKSERGNY